MMRASGGVFNKMILIAYLDSMQGQIQENGQFFVNVAVSCRKNRTFRHDHPIGVLHVIGQYDNVLLNDEVFIERVI
jgi:hypothetical protein